MKSRAPLALMEQMVMLLVFALAAALCLQAFVRSDNISRQSGLPQSGIFRQNALGLQPVGVSAQVPVLIVQGLLA